MHTSRLGRVALRERDYMRLHLGAPLAPRPSWDAVSREYCESGGDNALAEGPRDLRADRAAIGHGWIGSLCE